MSDPMDRRIHDSFARQQAMHSLGACLLQVEPGLVSIEMPFSPAYTQQDGFLHAGISTTLVDSACGYAALSMMPPGHEVLSVEFKVNLLAPALGERFVATGKVLRAGKLLTVVQGELVAWRGQSGKQVLVMQATMIGRAP